MPASKKTGRPHPRAVNDVDRRIGERIRTLRQLKKISQAELGDACGGISFQQIQKYEKGVNRVGASRLQQIAAVFGEPLTALLGNEERKPSADYTDMLHAFSNREVQRLVKAFSELPAGQRQRLVTLVECMAA